MCQLYGWAPRGKKQLLQEEDKAKHPPTIKVPLSRGVNLSVTGAISWHGIINLTLQTPKANKKCKVDGKDQEENS